MPDGLVFALLVLGIVGYLIGRSVWRRSEREHERWRSRRGEDEPRERFDDRGAFRRHWGGLGRPGSPGRSNAGQ